MTLLDICASSQPLLGRETWLFLHSVTHTHTLSLPPLSLAAPCFISSDIFCGSDLFSATNHAAMDALAHFFLTCIDAKAAKKRFK